MHKESKFLAFARPDITDTEVENVASTIASGWLTTGSVAAAFEQEFSNALGGDVTAVAVNSATAGMHLALEALGIGRNDEVLVPTWTFTATAEVVRYLGARPVFVDVHPDTLNIDLSVAEHAVTKRTRAIMPVHFAGLPVNYSSIQDFAQRHSLSVIEDAAHAFPASSCGVRVGSGLSDATVFSFYATKTMTTGEGGMIVTRDQGLAKRARQMRLHGIDRDVFHRYQSRTPSWRYDVIAPGYKYNMPDPLAALGRVQLARAHEMRRRRAEIANFYDSSFEGLPVTTPARCTADDDHAWHLYVIKLADETARDAFIERMAQNHIGCSVHFIPLHLLSYWKETYDLSPDEFPVSSAAFQRVVSLPLYSGMSDSDVERVTSTTRSLLS